MAVVNLEPAAVGNYDAWNLTAGADKVVAVATPDDGDTTRIGVATNGNRQSYTLDPLPAAASITSIDIIHRARDNNAGSEMHAAFTRLSATDLDYTTRTTTGSYQDFTESSVARPGGGSWVPSDFDSVELGVAKKNAGGGNTFITTLYATVTYVPSSSGGYYFLLASWLPPILAVAGGGLLKREIAGILYKQRIRPSFREEFDMIREALRTPWRYHLQET